MQRRITLSALSAKTNNDQYAFKVYIMINMHDMLKMYVFTVNQYKIYFNYNMNSLKIYVRGGALYWEGVWGPHKIIMTAEKYKKKIQKVIKTVSVSTRSAAVPS